MTSEEFNNSLTQRHGIKIYEKLKNSKVAIAGLGGLGSNVAITLARVGIGRLLLVDFDTVDITNLNRQQYFIDDIGKYKTTALTAIIRKINPVIKLDTINIKVTEKNVLEVFKGYNLVCECFDNSENKAMLINTLLTETENTTVISGSGMAGYGSSNTISTKKITDRLYICGDGISGIEQGLVLMGTKSRDMCHA